MIIEGYFAIKKRKFNSCKLLYALKLMQILEVFYHIFMNQSALEEQCNTWLKNPVHEFYRDSRDTNGHRPMTMIYWCNFNRVFEDNSKSNKNKNTIHYFTYNYTIQKVLNILEIIYCLFCMGLYLLIIYWNQEDTSQKIIMGKNIDNELSDNGGDDLYIDDALYEEELMEYKLQKNSHI